MALNRSFSTNYHHHIAWNDEENVSGFFQCSLIYFLWIFESLSFYILLLFFSSIEPKQKSVVFIISTEKPQAVKPKAIMKNNIGFGTKFEEIVVLLWRSWLGHTTKEVRFDSKNFIYTKIQYSVWKYCEQKGHSRCKQD
jgi:hypothetical protein